MANMDGVLILVQFTFTALQVKVCHTLKITFAVNVIIAGISRLQDLLTCI